MPEVKIYIILRAWVLAFVYHQCQKVETEAVVEEGGKSAVQLIYGDEVGLQLLNTKTTRFILGNF